MDEEDIRDRYTECDRSLTPQKRDRILRYGTESDRLLLRSFDDLGVLLDQEKEAHDTGEDR